MHLILLEEELPGADDLFGVITLTVLTGIVAHGLTATPGAPRYGRWRVAIAPDDHAMPDSELGVERRLRR